MLLIILYVVLAVLALLVLLLAWAVPGGLKALWQAWRRGFASGMEK